ncbi:MAG: hypothetical protein AAF799_48555 [Myxococcota bacterium]
MSTPAVPRADLLDVELPKAVWSKSGRPLMGRISRALFATTLLLLGMTLPWIGVAYGLMAAAVLGYFFIPVITDFLIERREGAIRSASAEQAPGLLRELDDKVLIGAFAPDAWVTLQRGRLQWAQGDGRAAAQAFADTARIIKESNRPALVSAQARALLLAGDRSGAREHLSGLADRDELSPRDHLDFGLIMLGEASRKDQARAHLESAYEGLDGHPQAAAGLAVALARAGEMDRGMELLAAAEADVDESDELLKDTIKKARKALRPAREAAKKKKKRKG